MTNREYDEKFQMLTADEKQMQDMQANLKESGMSGTMYRREDLAGMMDKLGDLESQFGGAEGGEGEAADGADDDAAASAEKDEM